MAIKSIQVSLQLPIKELVNCPGLNCTWKFTPPTKDSTEDGKSGAGLDCPRCKENFCSHCLKPSHEGMTCETYIEKMGTD